VVGYPKIVLEIDRPFNTKFFGRTIRKMVSHPTEYSVVEEMIKPLLHVKASIHTSLRLSAGGRRPSDENLDRVKGKHFPYRTCCRKL